MTIFLPLIRLYALQHPINQEILSTNALIVVSADLSDTGTARVKPSLQTSTHISSKGAFASEVTELSGG